MSAESQGDLQKNRLLRLMAVRVLLVTILMGSTAAIQLKEGGRVLAPSLISIYILVITSYFITLLSLITLKLADKSYRFADLQIATDILLATALIYVTGGVDSIFSFLYILIIIGAGIVLHGKGVFLTASLSSILYGALLVLQYYGYLPTLESPLLQTQSYSGMQVLYRVFGNITAFYTVAFLSRHLFVQLRTAGERLKEKEIDYEELEALYKKIVQGINTGLMTVDRDGFITSFNREAEKITGYSFLEAYKAKVEEIFPGLMDRTSGYKADVTSQRWEMPYLSKDGNSLHLGLSLSSLRDHDGAEAGSIIIFQDLTQYKEMEEAVRGAEKLAAVGKLAAGIAHEIRNPLASMSGSIQVLRDELELSEENRRLMGIILRETERLNRLITEFLNYARPYKPKKDEVDLGSVMMETLDIFEKGLSNGRGITIKREIMPEVKVCGERERLEEVLWNLFNNAVQSMQGEGELTVSLRKNDNMAVAAVRDTGEGIEEEDLIRVFEPFFTTKTHGSGLGLATVYRIIEAHEGGIRVESEKGKGTVFTILLPISKTGG
jgi:two-component system sensor histidine kinase PilS (NtrC family)